MAQIAYIYDGGMILWPSIILSLAAMGTVVLFLGLYLRTHGNIFGGFLTVPLAVILSLLGARMVHWYCFPGYYPGLEGALRDLTAGGFALVGVFGGCLLAAAITRLLFLHRNLPAMLDCMCVAGAAGIAVGRLASLFDSSDRGQILAEVHALPWAYPIVNAVSGATEYRLATFLLQAMACGCIFLVLLVFHLTGKKPARKDGDTALLFALLYSASQVVLDSTRYDSIYFRSNGFVSIVQVVAALALGMVIVVFSVRMVRNRGFRWWYLVLWAILGALIGGAGYMEYHVQRHGQEALFAYSIMSGCLAAVVLLTLTIRSISIRIPMKD